MQFRYADIFSHTTKHCRLSYRPAGCPTIKLNSDTVYLEIRSDHTVEGLSPQDCALPPPDLNADLKSSFPPVLLPDLL